MAELLILGLGNLLLSDDGLGVRAVERLARDFVLPPGVEAMDGGTLGLGLLGAAGECRRLLLVDAIRAEAPPGTLVRLEGAAVEPAVRERLSPHQIGVADLLAALRLVGRLPETVTLLGLVPASLELAAELTPAVTAALPELVRAVAREAARQGFDLRPGSRHEDGRPPALASHAALGL